MLFRSNDVVEDGVNGCLVPARNPAALSQAVVELLGQPEVRQRYGRASRQRAVQRFDLSVVVAQTSKHYRELLAHKTQRMCSAATWLIPLCS